MGDTEIRYLKSLAKQYPTIASAATEIIEASKSLNAMSRSLLGAVILAINSNAVRLIPVADT